MPTISEYCKQVYSRVYDEEINRGLTEAANHSRTGNVSESKYTEIETAAQKEAIKQATMGGMRTFPEVEAALIWRAVYETHIHRKSGILIMLMLLPKS